MKLIGRSKVFFVVETHCSASKVETGFKPVSIIGFLKNRELLIIERIFNSGLISFKRKRRIDGYEKTENKQ